MDFTVARHNMVESQVRTNRVTDTRLLEALDTVPREAFVPDACKSTAYRDDNVEIASGRYLLGPMVFARLIQEAQIRANEVILDVGCGTGYSSAILARLASTVVALESDKGLAARAAALLAEQGVDNVAVVEGPLPEGDKAHGPYDVIVVEGAVAESPEALTAQLAERGRLLAITQRPGGVAEAVLMLRIGNSFSTRTLFEAQAAILPGFARRPGFVF